MRGGGGVGGVLFADILFISTRLGSALKISNFITCLNIKIPEIGLYSVFHAEPAKIYI